MSAIFTFLAGIAPLMLRLGLWWLDKTGASAEAQKKFLNDFSAMQAQTDAALQARLTALGAVGEMEAWQQEQMKAITPSQAPGSPPTAPTP